MVVFQNNPSMPPVRSSRELQVKFRISAESTVRVLEASTQRGRALYLRCPRAQIKLCSICEHYIVEIKVTAALTREIAEDPRKCGGDSFPNYTVVILKSARKYLN
jgi:hypothetical protein